MKLNWSSSLLILFVLLLISSYITGITSSKNQLLRIGLANQSKGFTYFIHKPDYEVYYALSPENPEFLKLDLNSFFDDLGFFIVARSYYYLFSNPQFFAHFGKQVITRNLCKRLMKKFNVTIYKIKIIDEIQTENTEYNYDCKN